MAAAAAEEEDQGQQDPAKKSVAKPPADAVHKTSTALQEVEDLLRDSFPDLANSMSDSRVAELYAYATSTMEDSRRRSSYDSPTAKARRGWDGKDIPPKRTSQKKLLLLEKPRTGDSVDDLFPDLPSKDGLVKPDPVKVESLKHAIRLLRQRIQTREVSELQKLHYLLRTTVQPGVHSDIYCNELTEFEKQLKSVKYWTAPPDPRLKKKGNGSLEQKGQDFVSLYSEENETPRIPKSSTGGRSTTDDEGAVSSTAFETDTTVTTGFEATDDYDVYQNQIRAA
ncbi:uncharacterized protein LOC118438743 [Folsomia candida]|nr:uncharacterized protein LOC118438743 [Folsomia candida]